MKGKRMLKISLYILGSFLLIICCLFGFAYYQFIGKFQSDENKYPNYIGYINQETSVLNDKYKLCGNEIYKTHHGAPKDAFVINKKHYRNTILSEYKNTYINESGYLNFRFLVNCKGESGWFEIIEMNLDLEETNLNDEMVHQLLGLTSNPKHWNVFYINNVAKNYYMYISYRIENGEITEILP